MKRDEFVSAVAERVKFTKKDVAEVLKGIEEEVEHVVAIEDSFKFKFGTIGGKTREASECRNPKTGEKIKVPAKRGYPVFKISKTLKDNATAI